MQGRIVHLAHILENCEIVDAAAGGAGSGVVLQGTIVTVLYDGDDEPEKYLVGSIEEQRDILVVSPGSPMGAALLGSAIGDDVEYESPGGVLRIRVVEIE